MAQRKNLLLPDATPWPLDRPIIELRDVWKCFGELEVIRGLSLNVLPGKTTVIAGESGSGKSVLLKLMNGLMLPDEGEVFLFGQSLGQVSEQERTILRKRCTMVFQNYALIDSMTIEENIAFPLLQNTRLPAKEVYRLVRDLLDLLELPDTWGLLPASLSGGMKKRVALARAVISHPEVVLFDEPTTGLDPVMIEFVDEMIRRTQESYEMTSVVISHDMASNRRLADFMGILVDGKVADFGSFEHILKSDVSTVRTFMQHASTERMQSVPQVGGGDESSRLSTPIDKSRIEQRNDPQLPPAVRCFDLHKSFGEREVIKGISIEVPPRKISVIIGGSGSGKSVLVKHMIGLLKPTSGRVEVLGELMAPGNDKTIRALQRQIGVLFQGAALFDSMTVEENIAFPLIEGRRMQTKLSRVRAREIAEKMSVHELLKRFPNEISNGERKRVALARALITQPKLMIYDEPTTGQDPLMMGRVDDMILEASSMFEMTSIVISHDMSSTFRIADQISMISEGELLITGSPAQVKATQDERVLSFIFAGDRSRVTSGDAR